MRGEDSGPGWKPALPRKAAHLRCRVRRWSSAVRCSHGHLAQLLLRPASRPSPPGRDRAWQACPSSRSRSSSRPTSPTGIWPTSTPSSCRNLGHRADVQNVGTLDPAQPQIVITTDSATLSRLPPAAEHAVDQEWHAGLQLGQDPEPTELEDRAREGEDRSSPSGTDFPDEAKLTAGSPTSSWSACRSPRSSSDIEQGEVALWRSCPRTGPSSPPYRSSRRCSTTVLPQQRTIQVLSSGLPTADRGQPGGGLRHGWPRSGARDPGGPDRQETAAEFADSIVPPVVAPAEPADLAGHAAIKAATSPTVSPLSPPASWSFVGAVLLLIVGVVVARLGPPPAPPTSPAD